MKNARGEELFPCEACGTRTTRINIEYECPSCTHTCDIILEDENNTEEHY